MGLKGNKTEENRKNPVETPEMPLTKSFEGWMVDFGTVLRPA